MTDSVHPINNESQTMSKAETKPLAVSKYEHLEVLVETEEKLGEVPSKRRKAVERADSKAASAPKVWRTRRRSDGKVGDMVALSKIGEACSLTPKQMFLAAEYIDTLGVMNEAKETLLRLLNHPNLVSLVDIIEDPNVNTRSDGYTVWEDCTRGTLNRLLWHEHDQERL